MALLEKIGLVKTGVDGLKAQIEAKDAEIASLKAELAEVPLAAAALDEVLASIPKPA